MRRGSRLTPRVILGAVLSAGMLVADLATAAWYFPPVPYRPKDFALVKQDGVYHIFYTQYDTSRTAIQNETRFGHAVSRDLWHWTELSSVLDVRQGLWEHTRVWAPHIVLVDGVYYMFYTGVNEDAVAGVHEQSIGVATSTDLQSWTRAPAPLLVCGDIPWAFCDPSQPLGGDLRDPFVMRDPSLPGDHMMFYVTRLDADRDNMVVGTAASTGLFGWHDPTALMVTHASTTYSPLTESPHVMEHAGTYYLFWTTNAGYPIVFATSNNPHGPWTYRGRLQWMVGLDTRSWTASESMVDGASTYFGFVDDDRLDVRRISWLQGYSFTLVQPDTFHVYKMYWDRRSVVPGQTVRITLEAVGSMGRTAAIQLWGLNAEGARLQLANASLGLPTSVTFQQRSLSLSWRVRLPPTDEYPVVGYILAMSDGSAETETLSLGTSGGGGGGGTGSGTQQAPGFRLLASTPLSGGKAFLIDMPAAGAVRLELFDLAGRRVRTYLDEMLPAGPRVVPLSGDGAGEQSRRGLYFARLTGPWGIRVLRIVGLDGHF